jgi:hypothetical protein
VWHLGDFCMSGHLDDMRHIGLNPTILSPAANW